jgi:hypothetical protein
MTKLDSRPPSLTYSIASTLDPQAVRRLIVLFPAAETESPDLAHRIWEIARSLHANVLLLGLFHEFSEESQLRRNLVTLAAIIKDPNVSVEIMIEHGNDWVGQVRKVWRTGDIVACHENQKVGLMQRSLEQVLRSSLEAQIYILSGYPMDQSQNPSFLSRALPWAGSLAIIGAFFWAEIRIIQLPQDWAHSFLIYACVAFEVALIFLWNSLFA